MNLEQLCALTHDDIVIKRGVPAIFRVVSYSTTDFSDYEPEKHKTWVEMVLGMPNADVAWGNQEINVTNSHEWLLPEELDWQAACAILIGARAMNKFRDDLRRSF